MLHELQRYRAQFACNKAQVNAELASGVLTTTFSSGTIDHAITDLVRDINALPFMHTGQTCAGHFYSREELQLGASFPYSETCLPAEGNGLYADGFLQLVFAPSLRAKHCMATIRELLQDQDHAHEEQRETLFMYKDPTLQDLFMHVNFDNTGGDAWDPIELPIAEGNERIARVTKLHNEFHDLFLQY
ncbi:MAG: hypothetical protein OXR66_09710 [Candidatus Woesearchaeota archaeon]|nr:hypothetical protein [Candidatus Woesearchaeota archaeon]